MAGVDINIEIIACAAHNANMAYILGTGGTWEPAWDEAEEWRRESSRAGVKTVLENPDLTAEEIHAKWVEYKTAEGWVYGEVKDSEAKTHPCLLPWNELPEVEREKDYIFKAVVRDLWRVINNPRGPAVPSG